MNIPANPNSAANRNSTVQVPTAAERPTRNEQIKDASDTFSPMQAQILRDAILAGPPIRADRVAYAKQLLADPNYPPAGILKQVATQLVVSAMNTANAE